MNKYCHILNILKSNIPCFETIENISNLKKIVPHSNLSISIVSCYSASQRMHFFKIPYPILVKIYFLHQVPKNSRYRI